MEPEEDLGPVASTSFDPVDDVIIKPLPIDKEKEEHKWKEEEQKQKNQEQNREEEEERAEIEAARKEFLKLVLSRMQFLRKIGSPASLLPLANCKNLDYRKLLNRESNCDEIDWGNGPVRKEILLEKEKALWNAAMEYRKAQNMDSEYDLIPSHMTLFPIMSTKCMWYHCNLVGCKRETPLKGVQQYFFIEINITRVKTVTSCIALDEDVDNTCNMCPSHTGILHPRKGGLTCGSKEGPSKEDFGATPAR